jgi:hypothetical protein
MIAGQPPPDALGARNLGIEVVGFDQRPDLIDDPGQFLLVHSVKKSRRLKKRQEM